MPGATAFGLSFLKNQHGNKPVVKITTSNKRPLPFPDHSGTASTGQQNTSDTSDTSVSLTPHRSRFNRALTLQ
jgi:hypothetical protein